MAPDPSSAPLFNAGTLPRLLVLGAALVLLAGCGDVESDPNLAAVVAQTEHSGSSRIRVESTQIVDGEMVHMACSGRADYEGERLEIRCSYDEGDLHLIAIGGTTYMRGTARLGLGLPGDYWAKVTEGNNAPAFSPHRLVQDLRAASRETERVGEEEVRGAPTTRYRLEVSCGEVDFISCEGTSTSIEVSIDKEGYIRKVEFTEESGAAGEIEYYDFGAGAPIEPPPADQVIAAGRTGLRSSMFHVLGHPDRSGNPRGTHL